MKHDDPDPGSERGLLAAAQAGDERAFGSLTGRHRDGVELYCRLMLGCPLRAHAALDEAMLRGWRERGEIGASPSVRIWLYRLATEVCLENLGETDESESRPPFEPVNDDE